MYIKTVNGRDYYKCEKCKKMYSFASGRRVQGVMSAFCRQHGVGYPVPIKKNK